MVRLKFSELEGKRFLFYGVNENYVKLDDQVYKVVEDENDGYRSALDYVEVCPPKIEKSLVFRDIPLDEVFVTESSFSEDFDGLTFWSLTRDHTWLEIGTDNSGPYYPVFVFHFYPLTADGKTIKGVLT